MLLGSDNTKQLMVSIESLLRETVALINAGAGPDQPVLVRLLKDIRGQFETLNLRVEIPDEEHKALGGLGPFLLQGDHRDLFVSAVSGELVAAVLDSQDDLQQIRTATQVGGLVSNPLVQPSLQMVPPTSQWLLLVNSHETVRLVLELLRDAAIEPVDLAKLGESSPLILGVELRPTFFEVTVGVHVSTFEMLGVWISKVVGEAIQRQVEQ